MKDIAVFKENPNGSFTVHIDGDNRRITVDTEHQANHIIELLKYVQAYESRRVRREIRNALGIGDWGGDLRCLD